jgi:hypothetical protein
MSHEEIAELLGAYALDAVEPDEAAAVEAHVGECPRCAAELAEFREVVGLLANDGGNASEVLWDKIAAQMAGPPADRSARRPVAVGGTGRSAASAGSDEGRRFRTRRRLAVAVIGVAAAVIALMAVQLGRLDARVGQLSSLSEHQGVSQAAQAALLDPSAQRITMTGASTSGPPVAELVLLPSGSAFLINRHLSPLSDGQTYQLWGVVGRRAISFGLLGNRPSTVAFTTGPGAPVSAFAITAERAGGVVVTTHTPVARSAALAT